MAIVTVQLSYNSRLIDFTYDDSIVSLALENVNHVVFTFIGNLFPKNNFDSGISVDRNDRDILHIGVIKDSPFVPVDQIETKTIDYVEVVTKFAIRLGLDNTQSAIIAFTESLMVEEVKEPTPTGVKINYNQDSTFDVSYADYYGTPIEHNSYTGYDIVQVVSGDRINITSTHQDLKVTITREDEYGTPLADYVKVVSNGNVDIEIESEMLIANEIDMVVELISIVPPIEPIELIVNVHYVGTNYTTSLNNATQITYVENVPLTFTITANSGYTFNGSNGNVKIGDEYTTPVGSVLITGVGKTVNVNMNLDEFLDSNSELFIYIEPTPDLEQIVDVNQFINLYRVTTSILSELATKRYGVVNNEIYDYGERITNLYRLPIKVDNSLIVENENIILGDYDTNVKADLISDYVMRVNIDEITVPEIYNNSLDYVGVDCTLYLPFVSSITIEPRYCINQTISIEYSLNLLSGSVTINLYSSYSDELFYSSTEHISMQLPYLQGVNVHSPIGQLITTDINDISLAYIEVNRNKLANVNAIGFNQNRTGKLIDYVGYVEVSNIKLNSNATIGEMIDIENMLRNGVFINE